MLPVSPVLPVLTPLWPPAAGYVGAISWEPTKKNWKLATGTACALDNCYDPGAVANAAITAPATADAATSYLFNKAVTYKCGSGCSAGATVMTIKCVLAASGCGVKWDAKPACKDIDECASNSGCDHICTNIMGNVQAKCTCRSGFKCIKGYTRRCGKSFELRCGSLIWDNSNNVWLGKCTGCAAKDSDKMLTAVIVAQKKALLATGLPAAVVASINTCAKARANAAVNLCTNALSKDAVQAVCPIA